MSKRSVAASRLEFSPPQIPTLVDQPPKGEGWIHEVKFDGYRAQIIVENGEARVFTRNGDDWSWFSTRGPKSWPTADGRIGRGGECRSFAFSRAAPADRRREICIDHTEGPHHREACERRAVVYTTAGDDTVSDDDGHHCGHFDKKFVESHASPKGSERAEGMTTGGWGHRFPRTILPSTEPMSSVANALMLLRDTWDPSETPPRILIGGALYLVGAVLAENGTPPS